MAIFMAIFLSSTVFAVAPVKDITAGGNGNSQIEKQLQELTHLLETRNKMQVRLQNQIDRLSQEINQITGSIELFNHKIEQIENRQRNLYQLIEEKNRSGTKVASNESLSASDGNEKVAYQSAVDLVLVNKEYNQAITAFEAFVIDYPDSAFVANSQYWLGQLLYKEKKRNEARIAFLIVTEKYPDSSKRPDALFKIGIIDEYLGKTNSAKLFYQKVLIEYPDSSASSLAKKRLKGL